jgi:hypothetical protein
MACISTGLIADLLLVCYEYAAIKHHACSIGILESWLWCCNSDVFFVVVLSNAKCGDI